jgi:hypothetical protein
LSDEWQMVAIQLSSARIANETALFLHDYPIQTAAQSACLFVDEK